MGRSLPCRRSIHHGDSEHLFILLRRGTTSLIGMEQRLQGDINPSLHCSKFSHLMDQVGLVLAVQLPANPHFHFVKNLHIHVHGADGPRGGAFDAVIRAALDRDVVVHYVSGQGNYICRSLGIAIVNDPSAVGIPRKKVEALMGSHRSTRRILKKTGRRDRKRNSVQSHVTLSNQNKKDLFAYGGEATKTARAVPQDARDEFYEASATMLGIMKDFCRKHLGEELYHDNRRNAMGAQALSEAAFQRDGGGPNRRALHESITLYQSRLASEEGGQNLSFHTDRLNDWRRGYNMSASFSFIVRAEDGKSVDRRTLIFYTRKFIGDRLYGPKVDYPPLPSKKCRRR